MATDIELLIRDKYDGVRPAPRARGDDEKRLAAGEPLAYVIGWIPFLGLKIYLDSKPLIPRPETEWWVDSLVEALRSGSRVLDLCAGSGAVGCAILKHVPNAHVSFDEIDPAHEATIQKNIQINGLDRSRADIRIGDLFDPFKNEKFDVIAVNPPYIPSDRELPQSVESFEPQIALRSGNDGLDLIRRIASDASSHLNSSGKLWLECDSEHAGEALELVQAYAKHAELRTDPYGRLRLVVGYY